MFLNENVFSNIIKNVPLISIDLIVKNKKGQFLLGKRRNEPAKNYWFVPGGRIYKNETLDDAFKRIVKDELSIEYFRQDAKFNGVYEHFYNNNVFNDSFGTHYIALAHQMDISDDIKLNHQHSSYKWFYIDELLENNNVNKYTKKYFRG